jgi:hypothetical protein
MSQMQTSWPLKKTQQLVYVELGPHNGGMVLGICEEGFSFRAVAPVKTDGPVNFAFALDGSRRLQGTGEIAWSEEDGKTGGLKFSNVSPQFRESLRFWLMTEAESKNVGREVTPAVALPLDSMDELKARVRGGGVEEAKPPVPQQAAEVKAAPVQPVEAKSLEAKLSEAKLPEAKHVEAKSAEATIISVKPIVARPPEAKPLDARPVEKAPPEVVPQSPEPKQLETKSVEAIPAETKPVEKSAAEIMLPRPESPSPSQAPAESAPSLPRLRIYFPPASVEPRLEVIPAEKNIPAAAPADVPPEPMAPIFVPPPQPQHVALETPEPAAEVLKPAISGSPLPLASAEVATEESFTDNAPIAESLRLNRAAAAGIISLALAVILGALVLSFRREVGEALIRAGQMIAGQEKSGAENLQLPVETKPKPKSEAIPPEEAAYGFGTPGAATPADKSSSNPSKDPGLTSARNTPESKVLLPPFGAVAAEGGTGQNEFEQARNILKGNHRQRDLPLAVPLLWTAVRKGYVPAEVTLADLFARGDGVAQSCEQARILLEAAVQKGSPEGRRRLELLKQQGCP